MQGELAEIDVRSILHLVALGQRTGQLWIKTGGRCGARPVLPVQTSSAVGPRSWLICFVQGTIVYAGDPNTGGRRLQGLIERLQRPIDDLSVFYGAASTRSEMPEYGCLWALIAQRIVSPEQARNLLEQIIRETLFEVLGLHQGHFIFAITEPLTPELKRWETMPLVAIVAQQVQAWKQLYPRIQSPEQYPVIVDELLLRQSLPAATAVALIHYAERRLSLRQLAHALDCDILAVAKAIMPCLQRGWMHLTSWPLGESTSTQYWAEGNQPMTVVPRQSQRIVCIDSAMAIGELIVGMLRPRGYEVTAISDPLAALGQLFQLQPQLILCDTDLPQLNGYELCAMLRQSSRFHQIPILLLTDKASSIDRAQAKMVGATDYLVKPFSEDELLPLLEHYLSSVAEKALT